MSQRERRAGPTRTHTRYTHIVVESPTNAIRKTSNAADFETEPVALAFETNPLLSSELLDAFPRPTRTTKSATPRRWSGCQEGAVRCSNVR